MLEWVRRSRRSGGSRPLIADFFFFVSILAHRPAVNAWPQCATPGVRGFAHLCTALHSEMGIARENPISVRALIPMAVDTADADGRALASRDTQPLPVRRQVPPRAEPEPRCHARQDGGAMEQSPADVVAMVITRLSAVIAQVDDAERVLDLGQPIPNRTSHPPIMPPRSTTPHTT